MVVGQVARKLATTNLSQFFLRCAEQTTSCTSATFQCGVVGCRITSANVLASSQRPNVALLRPAQRCRLRAASTKSNLDNIHHSEISLNRRSSCLSISPKLTPTSNASTRPASSSPHFPRWDNSHIKYQRSSQHPPESGTKGVGLGMRSDVSELGVCSCRHTRFEYNGVHGNCGPYLTVRGYGWI